MRKAQISIVMELFGDQAANGHAEKVTVYADASTPYEAISAGFHELMLALQEGKRRLPSFGVREHSRRDIEPQEHHRTADNAGEE